RLIRDGAKLVETAQDILEELRWPTPAPTPAPALRAAGTPAASETDANTAILALIGYDPCGLDELASRSGLTAEALSVILLHLELEGRIASLPGGRYQRIDSK
ncbi:MAG: DNA-protecting protein DprA, partial [Candidatus Accumulibacter sp.]|nr:DNA-protecting protein DprA [Accumulibacter sp.]